MARTSAEHRAWRILVVSFAVFVLLCAATLYVLDWFIFRSNVDLKVAVSAARGTIRVSLPNAQEPVAITDERSDLESNSTIQTDATSQGVVGFADPRNNRPIAYLFVMRDSQIDLRHASAPRFDLNNDPFDIRIKATSGRYLVMLLPSKGRNATFQISTSQGRVLITDAGLYLLEVNSNWIRATVQEGSAVLTAKNGDAPITIKNDQYAYLTEVVDNTLTPGLEKSLLVNGQFTEPYSAGWKVYSSGQPSGEVENTVIDGLSAVSIDRSQKNWPSLILDHGETGLVQTLNVDISNYNFLVLQATFFIEEQSLSTCGVAGSECPLMIRITYTDPTGVDHVFIHGFYAMHDPSAGYPLLCDTCRAEHERIRLQSWYTYSENLIALLPPEQRPTFIKQISFYASGHAFKIYVSQMDLIASKKRPPDVTSN